MNFNDVLADMKSKLSKLEGIKTCKVGVESNLDPASYPMIRIMPTGFRKSESQTHRIADVLIYFGLPLTESGDGLETIFEELLKLEQLIVDATAFGADYRSVYEKTLVSDSSVEHYKLFGVQITVSYMV